MNEPTSAHELIMVMGVQRSGRNVLFDSLATDRTLSAFPEDIDSEFYCNFRFRKPSFYPLNYGDGVARAIGASSCAVLSSIVKVAPVPLPLLDA